jgi:hypothetical protein
MAQAAISSVNKASLAALPLPSRTAVREHSRWNRGADRGIGQRHPFGGADNSGHETHVTVCLCGGSGKNMLVRD